MIDAERVDFIAVPVRDKERALSFYGETLGLRRNPHLTDPWHEFETGNVTLPLVCHGAVFNDPDGNGLVLHNRYAPYADSSTP